MNQALPSLPKQTASTYSSFIGAADKLAAAGGAGLNLTPDALKGIAHIIAPTTTADPLAYTTNVDSGLRSLLGFGPPLAAPGVKQSGIDRRFFLPKMEAASILPSWLDRTAMAGEPETSPAVENFHFNEPSGFSA